MKPCELARMRRLLWLVCLFLSISGDATAAPPKSPQGAPAGMEFDRYELVLLMRARQPPELSGAEVERIQAAHLAHLGDLYARGKIVAYGPFDDQADASYRGM